MGHRGQDRTVRPGAAFFALSLAALSGCIPWRGPDDVARVIERETGGQYDRDTGLTLGRCGLTLARWVVNDEDVPLKGVHKVEVGVYTRTRTGEAGTLEAASFPDWSPLVEVRDDDERVLVLSAPKDGKELRRLLIVVEDGEELSVVRLRGHLDHMLSQALDMAFHEVDKSNLTAPTLAALERETPGP